MSLAEVQVFFGHTSVDLSPRPEWVPSPTYAFRAYPTVTDANELRAAGFAASEHADGFDCGVGLFFQVRSLGLHCPDGFPQVITRAHMSNAFGRGLHPGQGDTLSS